jgi:hypothetical protein
MSSGVAPDNALKRLTFVTTTVTVQAVKMSATAEPAVEPPHVPEPPPRPMMKSVEPVSLIVESMEPAAMADAYPTRRLSCATEPATAPTVLTSETADKRRLSLHRAAAAAAARPVNSSADPEGA